MTGEKNLGKAVESEAHEPFPESYKGFLEFKDGKYVNTEYKESAKHTAAGYEIPAMVLSTSPAEIGLSQDSRHAELDHEAYYDENGFPWAEYEHYNGLKNYHLYFKEDKPLYVFDNHVHAKFAWQEAREAGVLGDKVALIRLDAHLDLLPCPDSTASSRADVKQEIVVDKLNIKNFTEPDLRAGLIDKMYFCSGQSDLNVVDEANRRKSLRGRSSHVSTPEGISEMNTVLEYARQDRFEDISPEVMKSFTYLVELMQDLKRQGYDIILDVDFDIFGKPGTEQLLENLLAVAENADVVTCATSPRYENQGKAVTNVKKFVGEFLR
ncbi:MAG: UPF0489 family protein [Parcubacteria group bacterium]|nr:UPF0489 family protein [Parcubacteria group bacterium]